VQTFSHNVEGRPAYPGEALGKNEKRYSTARKQYNANTTFHFKFKMATESGSCTMSSKNVLAIECNYCGRKIAVKQWKCVKCLGVFHPSCFNTANLAKNPYCVREKEVNSTGGVAEVIIEFLKSDEFMAIVEEAVSAETHSINEKIKSLELEVTILRKSNIDLIKLLTKNKDKFESQHENLENLISSQEKQLKSHNQANKNYLR
jgi:hypothetical protein